MSDVAELYFLLVVLGLPALLLAVALVAAHFYAGGAEELLDWRPTRSPEREAELDAGELEQMLGALNRYRRMRGAPERTLEQVSGRAWAGLDRFA
ncbi:MAG TPA: hypothetical protein VL979_04335 [Solirubrobacteraceae bacterium]|nr:hypothetical protein [Solirubrobacteraceae bacterium]